MHYFELHEDIYARRLAHGVHGWDDGTFDAFAMRELVCAWLAVSNAAAPGARVLELGCGTGALACMLAAQGFRVTAIDVSASAIQFARSMAARRSVAIEFEVGNVCDRVASAGHFDVVIDSHLLHCIAFPDERRRLLAGVSAALAPGGEFWVDTMVLGDGLEATPTRRIDDAGIVWSAVADASGCSDAIDAAGICWVPMRYLAAGAQALLDEFAAAGLEPIEWRLAPAGAPGEQPDLQARLVRRALPA